LTCSALQVGDAALLALAVMLLPGSNGSSSQQQLQAHWACVDRQGGGWQPPPGGWHTEPMQSWDAGGGAWRSGFAPSTTTSDGSQLQTLLLQVPLTGVLG
jgi:hypothetical protein